MSNYFDQQMNLLMDWENFDFEEFCDFIGKEIGNAQGAERLRHMTSAINKLIKDKFDFDLDVPVDIDNDDAKQIPSIIYMIRDKLLEYYLKLGPHHENTTHAG